MLSSDVTDTRDTTTGTAAALSARSGRPAPRSASAVLLRLVMAAVAAAFIVPLLVMLSASFSEERQLNEHGYALWPRGFTLDAYRFVLENSEQLVRSYAVSVVVTTVGTTASLLIMSLMAFALSRPDFRLAKPLAFLVLFTMIFNGGLVPLYIVITRYYQLQDTIWVLILPYLVAPWYVLLLRTYFKGLPADLFDAARIDGAGELRTFWSIVLPLSKPALGAVGLFVILQYWNDWWLGLLYIQDRSLMPVQLLLYRVGSSIDFALANPALAGQAGDIPVQSARAAIAMLAIGPIVLAFFFLQKFLIKGITLGGVKD
ncbi:carbohydrate ABC transporter permease [Micromonospora cathayae]|uniref:Carbohydrate ABC transporter permease n=1 Tax=Micromonospora cathayae TaxID=3028804 RepID=A0ABY8A0B4_9ACTN|nr:carbohydrate ABC transporter permease [Micromonospora sp. HUAS 3]WDZ87762.1 carbohydrate ABC transporter permease [Micromonospora sp. HUAS 3]